MQAALSQQNVVASADRMSATGSVVLRAAQDVTSGTRSAQEFVNGTFVCDHSILSGTAVDATVRPDEACQLASDDVRAPLPSPSAPRTLRRVPLGNYPAAPQRSAWVDQTEERTHAFSVVCGRRVCGCA